MESRQLDFSSDVIRIVRELCKVIFNVHSSEQMENIFGVSYDQMEEVIQKIIAALPERIFLPGNAKKMREIKSICAREFIFFQVQEKWSDPHYADNLKSFIKIFSKDIDNKI